MRLEGLLRNPTPRQNILDAQKEPAPQRSLYQYHACPPGSWSIDTLRQTHQSKSMPQLEPQTSRARALKKLGLTEEDVHLSKKLFSEMSSSVAASAEKARNLTKAERLLGYNEMKLKRSKALRLLGATEDDIELECSKNLGSLGRAGRRRSFIVEMDQARNSSRLHSRLSLGNAHRRTFFGAGRASSRRTKEMSGGGGRKDRSKTLPHSRRRRGSSSSLSSSCGGSRSTGRRCTQ